MRENKKPQAETVAKCSYKKACTALILIQQKNGSESAAAKNPPQQVFFGTSHILYLL